MKKILMVTVCIALALTFSLGMLTGCGETASEEPQYADQAYLVDMANGLEARWAISENVDETAKDYDEKETNTECVDAELTVLEKYAGMPFEDTKLQELAIQYINALKDQKSALEYYSSDYDKYLTAWDEAYNERAKLMVEINKEYGLDIDEKYEKTWKDFLDTAKVANQKDKLDKQIKKMLKEGKFEKKEEYGSYNCYLTCENTTDTDFASFECQISFLDSDGVTVETTSDYAENWSKGSKMKFTFYCGESFDKYEVTAGYYEQK